MMREDEFDRLLRSRIRRLAGDLERRPSSQPAIPTHQIVRERTRWRPLVGLATVTATLAAGAAGIASVGRLHGGVAGSSEAAKPADAIYADALAALSGAHAYAAHIRSADGRVVADILVDATGSLDLTTTSDGQTRRFVVVGQTLYGQDPYDDPGAGMRWVQLDAQGLGVLVRSYFAPQHFATCLLADHGPLSTRGVTTLGQQRVIALHAASTATTAAFTVDIAADGAPFPVRVAANATPTGATPRNDCSAPQSSTGPAAAAVSIRGAETTDITAVNAVPQILAPPDPIVASTPTPRSSP